MRRLHFRLLAISLSFVCQVCFAQNLLDPVKPFEKGMNLLAGSPTTRSGSDAVMFFRRSAELGYAPAETVLGYLYETGTFVAQDPGEALTWYKKAARQGDSLGQWLAGRIVYLGSASTRDLNEAVSLLQSPAEEGNPFAQYLLGKIKLERQQYSQSADWLRKAAGQGLPQAQRQLAILLRNGQGVKEDKFEAYVWLVLSQQAGFPGLDNDLQALETDLGGNETERAKSKAHELESSVTRSVSARGCTGWAGEFADVPSSPPPDLQKFCR